MEKYILDRVDAYPDIYELFSAIKNEPSNGIESNLKDSLIDTDDMEAIDKAILGLKKCPYSLCALECTLDPDTYKTDFSLSLGRIMADAIICGARPVSEWIGNKDSCERERTLRFLDRWLDKRLLFYHSIYSVYLELDTSTGGNSSVPGIFVRLQSGNKREEWYETLSLAVLDSLDIELTRKKREFINNFYRNFVSAAEFFQLGIMFSRVDFPIKLVAIYIKPHEARRALGALGLDLSEYIGEDDWKDIETISKGYINVSLDFTDSVGKRIGIEIESLKNDKDILEWVVKKGCCSIDKSKAVLNWTGGFSFVYPKDSGQEVSVEQKVSHYKLLLQPDSPMRAKVYLQYSVKMPDTIVHNR